MARTVGSSGVTATASTSRGSAVQENLRSEVDLGPGVLASNLDTIAKGRGSGKGPARAKQKRSPKLGCGQ
jgi:hypothetical protein